VRISCYISSSLFRNLLSFLFNLEKCFSYVDRFVSVAPVILFFISSALLSSVVFIQYFYNPQTSQFLYWNSSTQSYLPAPTNTEATDSSSSSNTNADNNASSATTSSPAELAIEKEKVERVKQAKKIVKVNDEMVLVFFLQSAN